MKKDYTDITVVLDRSGSMENIASDTIGGFNTFLKQQQETPGQATFTLAQFDDQYQLDYICVPIKDVKPLDSGTYKPRGWTALWDAVGKTIVTVGERLSALSEEDRPELVVFVILTDGLENSSKEYAGGKIKEMIEHQTTKYNWQFIYLGANQDAVLEGSKLGVGGAHAMSYSPHCMPGVYTAVSSKISSYRGTKCSASLDFNEEERDEAMYTPTP